MSVLTIIYQGYVNIYARRKKKYNVPQENRGLSGMHEDCGDASYDNAYAEILGEVYNTNKNELNRGCLRTKKKMLDHIVLLIFPPILAPYICTYQSGFLSNELQITVQKPKFYCNNGWVQCRCILGELDISMASALHQLWWTSTVR